MQSRIPFLSLLTAFLFCFLTSACTITGLSSERELELSAIQLLDDSVFPDHQNYSVESKEQLFYLSEEARAFVDNAIQTSRDEEVRIANLIEAIFALSDLDLIYQEAANTVADDTFRNAAANCLSLSIMTYAMADYAGFNSLFQEVEIPEYWTRRDGYSLLNGHINLQITPRMRAGITSLFQDVVVVDFDSEISAKRFPAKVVNENLVLAMFYNNRGTDALLANNYNQAYAYLKAAIEADRQFDGAWVNLGYLYRLMGESKLAEQSYLYAIAIDENHYTAWENLAILYKKTGNMKEANAIQQYIKAKRKNNPFYHLMLGQIQKDQGNVDESIQHFQQAIRLDDSHHQFYFNLASAFYEKGDLRNSQRYMGIARRKAGADKIASAYASKVSAISELQRQQQR